MRGLPGSGKSFLAKEICDRVKAEGVIKISTDDIWETPPNNEYLWIGELIGAAHRISQAKAREACKREIPHVIIDNTNTIFKEIEPYIRIAEENGYEVEFVQSKTSWAFDIDQCTKRNSHSVPREVIEKMANRFESHESVLEKYKNYSIEM